MGHALVRIVFDLEEDAWHRSATERLWAEPLGSARYRLLNTPFFAFGVSNRDVVWGKSRGNQVYFADVSIRGGHSSYRLKLATVATEADFVRHWEPLERLGCSYEEGPVLAIDVPPSTDIYAVYEALESGMLDGIWDFEEGHCGHTLRKTPSRSRADST